jgi:hypothetical protein
MKGLLKPDLEKLLSEAMDVAEPEAVQVQVAGKTLWVNVNGVCLLRICRPKTLQVEINGAVLMEQLGEEET